MLVISDHLYITNLFCIMKTVLLSSLIGLALASSASAQTVSPTASSLQDFSGPVQHYTLHYATGVITKDTAADASQLGVQGASVPSYANNCTTGSFFGAGADEVIDWGVKAAGASSVVDSFVIGYATDAVDTTIGGPGATLDIAFYEGTLGFGALGTEAARYSLAGLPGSASGGFAGYALTVDLTGGFEFCLADGPIGYGYCTLDPGTTGPLITDIGGCPNGQDDAFDSYVCPATAGVLNGTFFFGGSPTASWFIEIYEDDGLEVATTALNNGSGINPVVLTDGGVAPVLNGVWPVMVDTASSGHGLSACLWYKGSLPAGSLIIGAGEVIVDPTSSLDFSSIVVGTGLNDHSIAVPKDVTLIGTDYTVQAILYTGGPPVALSNAIDINVGF
ncbi:MAG: hypothetical protein ACI8QS_000905 [Planctomycetota bacterium]